jgi:ribosomal protein S18 acetylase RimI-like enzyme
VGSEDISSELALHARPALLADVAELLVMMRDFNQLEGIQFEAQAIEPPLCSLIGDPSLGVVCMLEQNARETPAEASAAGYFVLTWNYDLEWRGRDAMLTELYLRPALRGRRLGKAAMAEVERAALRGGAFAIHLAVRPENSPARRLYESAGFADPKRLLMTKELSRSVRSTL